MTEEDFKDLIQIINIMYASLARTELMLKSILEAQYGKESSQNMYKQAVKIVENAMKEAIANEDNKE